MARNLAVRGQAWNLRSYCQQFSLFSQAAALIDRQKELLVGYKADLQEL